MRVIFTSLESSGTAFPNCCDISYLYHVWSLLGLFLWRCICSRQEAHVAGKEDWMFWAFSSPGWTVLAFSAFPCRRQNLGPSPSLWSFIEFPVYSHLSCTGEPGGAGELPCRGTSWIAEVPPVIIMIPTMVHTRRSLGQTSPGAALSSVVLLSVAL